MLCKAPSRRLADNAALSLASRSVHLHQRVASHPPPFSASPVDSIAESRSRSELFQTLWTRKRFNQLRTPAKLSKSSHTHTVTRRDAGRFSRVGTHALTLVATAGSTGFSRRALRKQTTCQASSDGARDPCWAALTRRCRQLFPRSGSQRCPEPSMKGWSTRFPPRETPEEICKMLTPRIA